MPFHFIAPQFAAPQANPCAGRRSACGPSSAEAQTQYNPLLDLLQAFESEFTAPAQKTAPKVVKRTIVPHFDVLETSTSYILEGELPGVSDRSSLDIQFDDRQTLVVKGEVSRRSHDEVTTVEVPVAPTPAQAEKSLKPTVEETVDASESGSDGGNDEFEVVDTPAAAQDPAQVAPTTETKTTTKKAKYWVNERAIGVFERSFSFQGLVDQDNVKASLLDGVLTIVVPKRDPVVRRVQIE